MADDTILDIDDTGAPGRKLQDARIILEALDFPRAQLNDRSALTLLALLDMRPAKSWQDAQAPLIGITPIMKWAQAHYGVTYAPNSRESFRKDTMHHFAEAALAVQNPDQPGRATNSPKWCYQIEPRAFELLRHFGTDTWDTQLAAYKQERQGLRLRYAKGREMQLIPVVIGEGQEVKLSPGKHSELIKDIIEKFGGRYAPAGKVLYVGDTGDKWGYFNTEALKQLGVTVDSHGKMPDVVIHDEARNWLLLIESVTSRGPVDGKRHDELARLFSGATAGLVYVTAFPTRRDMARYLSEISWETEVWVAEAPDHLIHFDGKRYLGPYDKI
jgi:hypothetical protein